MTLISGAGDSVHNDIDCNRLVGWLRAHVDTSLAHVVIVLVFTYFEGGEWQREGLEVNIQI